MRSVRAVYLAMLCGLIFAAGVSLTLLVPGAPMAQRTGARALPAASTSFTVSATQGWQQTPLTLTKGQAFNISYGSGQWTVDSRNWPYVGVDGYDQATDAQILQVGPGCKVLSFEPFGTLLGKQGDASADRIPMGDHSALGSGPLLLRINDADSCLGDNAGSITVSLSVPSLPSPTTSTTTPTTAPPSTSTTSAPPTTTSAVSCGSWPPLSRYNPASVLAGQRVRYGVTRYVGRRALTTTITWGDDTSESHTLAEGEEFWFGHQYAAPGTYYARLAATGVAATGAPCSDDISLGSITVLQARGANQQGTPRYVALGDSFSSGEGIGGFYTFDTDSDVNKCHRHYLAYGPRLSRDLGALRNPLDLRFYACSGAVTNDFYQGGMNGAHHKNEGELAQIDALKSVPGVAYVTLTVGGNDVIFPDVMEACVKAYGAKGRWGCKDNDTLKTAIRKRLAALQVPDADPTQSAVSTAFLASDPTENFYPDVVRSLARLYKDIADAAPTARIFVGGYPHLFSSYEKQYAKEKEAPSKRVCRWAPVGFGVATVDYWDAQWINTEADALNATINDAITAAQKKGVKITFVSARWPFQDHGICDEHRWVNFIKLRGFLEKVESFHPTRRGQREYECMFWRKMGFAHRPKKNCP